MGLIRTILGSVGHEALVPLAKFSVAYLILARFFKLFSKTVQLHSIVHCVIASIWTGYALYLVTHGQLFSLQMYDTMQNIDKTELPMLMMTAFHSTGYFVADTIDIFIDHTNKKRQIYVMHHLAAIFGLLTIYWESYIAVVGLWILELGGLVHHIKYAAHVFEVSRPFYIIAEALYHSVYLSSRLYLLVAVSYGAYKIHVSKNFWIDSICFSVVYFLVAQNLYWWVLNVKMLLYPHTPSFPKEETTGGGDGPAEKNTNGNSEVRSKKVE